MASFADRYPPISDYALIGDSRACALVSRDGGIDWMCVPRFDSPSLFGRLLDWERGGYFQIAPAEPYESSRRYIESTNVLETTFTTGNGVVALTDFMPALDDATKSSALWPLRSLFRRVDGVRGRVKMRLEYVPRPEYSAGSVRLRADSPHTVTAARGGHVTHLRSDITLDSGLLDARASFDVEAGERIRFSMSYSFGEPAVVLTDRHHDEAYARTIAYWRTWSSQCTYRGPYADAVLRSALALKLMAYAPSGAIVAAPTTSLPEYIGGERNWDYRYCWLRDAAFTVKALLALGFAREAEAFGGWLLHATNLSAPRLDPLYTVHGESRVPERHLDHFEGYRGSRPVRIGNGAAAQHQLDVYGELLDAVHFSITTGTNRVSGAEASFIRRVADHVVEIWREPDNGIWEPRLAPRHYTHSKVMAWGALTHAADLVERGLVKGDAAGWRHEAGVIRATVLDRGYNESLGAFTQELDGDALDAAVLTFPLVGFIDANDPRMVSTVNVVRSGLSRDGFLYRYRNADGLSGDEGTFLVCNFWLAAALAHAGRIHEARDVFERTLGAANDVGLMPEEFAPATQTALGNMPQALSHLALIVAALAIDAAESRVHSAGTRIVA